MGGKGSGKPPKILITHPSTGERLSISEWANRLGHGVKYLSYKYHMRYKKGLISLEEFLTPNRKGPYEKSPAKKAHKVKPTTSCDSKKVTYVFRAVYGGDSPIYYEAYDPEDLINPVMDSIVQNPFNGGWYYNSYPFGCFESKNALVREYLKGDWQKEYPELKHGY